MHWPWYSFLMKPLLEGRSFADPPLPLAGGVGGGRVGGRTGPPPGPPPASGRGSKLNRVLVLLAGADAQRGFDRRDEDLAVADAAGLGGGGDRLDHGLGLRVGHDHLELNFGQEIDDVFGAAIEFSVAL